MSSILAWSAIAWWMHWWRIISVRTECGGMHWHNFHNFSPVCHQNRIKMKHNWIEFQDEIEVQTLAFIQGIEHKYNIHFLVITFFFIGSPPIFRGSNCNLYFVENHLQAMIPLSLEIIDITRDWVSSFVVVCQAFTAADFSCCLFVGPSVFSFVFSKLNACSIGLKSGDWHGHCRIFHFFTFKNSWVVFFCMFWLIVHPYYEVPCNQLWCNWLNLGRQYISIHFRINPAATVFCHIITKHQ